MLKVIRLTGKTAKGKMVVKRDGSLWVLKKSVTTVLWTADAGPWMLLENEAGLRWLHTETDPDFEVEVEIME